MQDFDNLRWRRFGRLVVEIALLERDKDGRILWRCECDCGKFVNVPTLRLKSGNTKSCGCLQRERSGQSQLLPGMTKGMKNTPEYKTWCSMKYRCSGKSTNKANIRCYTERNIKVCDRWLHSFVNFYKDMGPRPSKRHSIDRINNDGHYEPSNCRWATRFQQARNRRERVHQPWPNRSWKKKHDALLAQVGYDLAYEMQPA